MNAGHMTGPEHYKAAEELLSTVDYSQPDDSTLACAHAQVHATLALAAATIAAGNVTTQQYPGPNEYPGPTLTTIEDPDDAWKQAIT